MLTLLDAKLKPITINLVKHLLLEHICVRICVRTRTRTHVIKHNMPTMEPMYLLQSPLGQDQVAVIKMWPAFEESLRHCPYCANCCI